MNNCCIDSRKTQHNAQICTTALFHMLAPTCFGSTVRILNCCTFWFFTHIFTGILIFNGLTARHLYKLFGVKGLNVRWQKKFVIGVCACSYEKLKRDSRRVPGMFPVCVLLVHNFVWYHCGTPNLRVTYTTIWFRTENMTLYWIYTL
jgi:hypothetical protein